ncbi:MAG: carbohydrate ABC transporter permease [Chloroflexi bacterium]|nr:carbohydrate ABC transporter permease [Chloroflexota bacterium]
MKQHGLFWGLLLFSIFWLIPIWWMIVTAFKPDSEIFTLPPRWIPSHFTLQHVHQVLEGWPFLRWVFNSFIVAGGATILSLFLSIPAAYSFARMRWPGRNVLFIIFISSMLLPWQVNAVPLFFLMNKLKLLNSYLSVILPIAAMPIGVFLLRQFFVNFPRDLEDAARIDGCSHLGILIRIVLPNSVAALVAMGLYIFIFSWNEFFWSLIALQAPEKLTLPIGLKMLHGARDLDYGLLMAGATLASLPALVLFILFRRRIIRGIALTSGIKG